MIRIGVLTKLLRREAWEKDPKLNWVIGIWLGLSIVVENSARLSAEILQIMEWRSMGALAGHLEVIAAGARFQQADSAVWVYFVVSSLPMTAALAMSGGFGTYVRVTRRVLGFLIFVGLAALSVSFLIDWMKVFNPTDNDFWSFIFYETPFGASVVIGSFAFVAAYSSGYIMWTVGSIVRKVIRI